MTLESWHLNHDIWIMTFESWHFNHDISIMTFLSCNFYHAISIITFESCHFNDQANSCCWRPWWRRSRPTTCWRTPGRPAKSSSTGSRTSRTNIPKSSIRPEALELSVLWMLIPVIGKLNWNSCLLSSLWDIEKPSENTIQTPFSNEWGHLYETGLPKTV